MWLYNNTGCKVDGLGQDWVYVRGKYQLPSILPGFQGDRATIWNIGGHCGRGQVSSELCLAIDSPEMHKGSDRCI